MPASLPGAEPFPADLRLELAARLEALGDDYRPRSQHLRENGSPHYSNRLLLESSPYLLQHAHNPVNWYPWGDEAFAAAARLGRPVLVSIGYSTCHWCHVMEEESFDSPELARYLNQHFIAIKVDRESRPDVDSVYMAAVHAMGQRGGWPLNVWLTPQRQPFYGGTYFPPKDTGQRPSFLRVLQTISEQYAADPKSVAQQAEEVARKIRRGLESRPPLSTRLPDARTIEQALELYSARSDRGWGGVGQRTKFPSSLPLRLLLRHHGRTGDEDSLAMAVLTLDRMAAGGIHDQLGGGFHRYATDRRWLIPHFEKMLYDNALLARTYVEAWQHTGQESYAGVARGILEYVRREMTSPDGAFYSATDADSLTPSGEREEGWFFTWTPGEMVQVLGKDRARMLGAWYGVSEQGDLEGRSVLRVWRPTDAVAQELGVAPEQLAASIAGARPALLAARAQRPAPLRDDKILAAWNGLMISAFANAGFAFDDASFIRSAEQAASFLLESMRHEGRLQRIYLDGRASGPAFLSDYAFVIAGLLDLYEAAFDPRWLREALALQQQLDAHYRDPIGGYFETADDAERLIAREKPKRDGALPSGNSVAASNLLRLYELTTKPTYLEAAGRLFSSLQETLESDPGALSELLLAVEYHLSKVKEIVIVGPARGGDMAAMLAPLRVRFLPNKTLSVLREGEAKAADTAILPLTGGKRAIGGRVTAYVCVDRVCAYPTSSPEELAKQLADEPPAQP
ncbi:MAG: thioredoxin domain-containing protein [Deltaproteobacteria bacterium]|nr:thioredoxin domain-containing protein [Deltaproteobacteria bacterium]MBW2418077.1 thioredoxin domain-containing protein [Deltaproteobacteria bacterium]